MDVTHSNASICIGVKTVKLLWGESEAFLTATAVTVRVSAFACDGTTAVTSAFAAAYIKLPDSA